MSQSVLHSHMPQNAQQLPGIQLLHALPHETRLLLENGPVQAVLTVNLVSSGKDVPAHYAADGITPMSDRPSRDTMSPGGGSGDATADASTADEIYGYIEQALKDYSVPMRLSRNPLVDILQLKSCKVPAHHMPHIIGIILQLWLDYAIDTVSKVRAEQKIARLQWRLHHYLHLRYREHYRHQEIAEQLGYTKRHIARLRKEYIAEIAELILLQG